MTTDSDRDRTLLPFIASHGLIHGLSASLPALLPLIMEEFNLNYTEVGILSFSLGASIGMMSILTGILSDIMRNKINILGYALLSTGIFSFFIIFTRDYISLLFFMVILGFLLSFYHPLALSYIAIFFRGERGRVFGMHEIGANLGLAAAPAIAGFLAPQVGWRVSYAVLAMPAVFSALFILSMNGARVRMRVGKENALKESATSAESDESDESAEASMCDDRDADGGGCDGAVRARGGVICAICDDLCDFVNQMRGRFIRQLYIAEGIFGFVVGGVSTFIPLYLVAEGFSVAFAGVVTGVFLAFGAIGKYLGGVISDIFGGRSAVSIGFLLAAPLFLAVPLMPCRFLSLVPLVLAGMTFPMALSAIITCISSEIPHSRTGIAFGFMMFAGFGFGSLSRPILGLAGDTLGISSIFFIISAVSLIGGAIIRS